MAIVGIIAEYNPFHAGHAWQLAAIRQRFGPDTAIVVAMSGNFVQRGDFALLGKHARAEAALRGGADLVLELPTPWCTATAERFAHGGVALLASTGVVTHLAFGCECGQLAPLQATAAALDTPAYHAAVQTYLAEGLPFAAARQASAAQLTSDATCLSSPNNALAVEYLRALRRLESPTEPVALPRVGAGHDSDAPGAYPSASAIRAKVLSGGQWQECLPEPSAEILRAEITAGRAPVSMDRCQRAVLAKLRTMNEEEFLLYDGGGEGLYHRFYACLHREAALEDVLSAAKTKRYPMARLRRMLLQSYLGILPAGAGDTPPYLRILGAAGRGRALLRQMAGTCAVPLLTKPADVRLLGGAAARLFAQEARCTDLYTLAYPALEQSVPGSEYTRSPVILR